MTTSKTILGIFAFLQLCCSFCPAMVSGQVAEASKSNPEDDATDRRIVVITTYLTTPSRISKLTDAAMDASLRMKFLAAEAIEESTDLQEQLKNCALVLMDLPHASVTETLAKKCGKVVAESSVPFVILPDVDATTKRTPVAIGSLANERSVPAPIAQRIRELWRFGGKSNTKSLVSLLAARDWNSISANTLEPARPIPDQGAYRPDWPEIAPGLSSVQQHVIKGDGKTNLVAIAINRAVITADDVQWLDLLIERLGEKGMYAYAFYGPRQNSNLYRAMTCIDGKPIVKSIINAALVFRANDRKQEFEEIGVPVLQTMPSLAMNREEWAQSRTGLSLSDIAYYYASSEQSGMIDPVLITAKDSVSGIMRPIEGQIQTVVEKAAMLCQIQSTPSVERKVAIMVYNYPGGASNFGASFLNVPKSVVNISSGLKVAGYKVDVPEEEQLTSGIQRGLSYFYADSAAKLPDIEHAARLPLSDYLTWFRALPVAAQQRIESYWGDPSNSTVEENGQRVFVIPRILLGNIAIVPQPPRFEISNAADSALRKKRIGHRSSVPISHQYLATYGWIRDSFHAQSAVHLGTHGTVEWLPGKERGLSAADDPYLALRSLNNVYPYIMDNLGEATTAKRRGRATIISHMTPMFTPSGFRPGLHEMHDLMHDWENVDDGSIKQTMEKRLVELFVEHRLDRDLNWSPSEIASRFAEFMEVLHPYLDDIAQSAQPLGLATFGEVPAESQRIGMVMQMMRKPLIEALGEDIDEVFLLGYEKVLNSRPARWLRLAISDSEAASRVDLRQIDALQTGPSSSVPNRSAEKPLEPPVLLELGKRAQLLYASLSSNDEMSALIDALDGKHIKSSYGGDPVRNPESMPTGRNLYGFDPSRIPTRQAWELGKQVFDDWLIAQSKPMGSKTEPDKDSKGYPAKVAFSLWAGETMRHQGVMESQVLYALGVRPLWDDAGRVIGIETIPQAELARPRIDVVLSVTGSYRDQFPLLMEFIDKAVITVSQLDERDNLVSAGTKQITAQLLADGVSKTDAERLATLRIFSNEPGVYGTGVNDAVAATDLWESQTVGGQDNELARLFVDRMGFAFGKGTNSLDPKVMAGLFAKQLSNVEAAFVSRSSNTYGVLTSDDAFAYGGGLTMATKVFSGKSPELFVQNLRDESEVIVDRVASAIAKEMQSRYLHPQWILSQKEEGYSGTLQVLKTSQFLWGWQVTDPKSVRDDQWQSLVEVYVDDVYKLGTKEWLTQDNPAAFAQMIERLLDATRLGYWKTDEATTQKLIALHTDLKSKTDLLDSNQAIDRFVSERRRELPDSSKTMATVDASAESLNAESVAAGGEQVSGMELRENRETTSGHLPLHRNRYAIPLAIVVGCVGLGAFREFLRPKRD